ncbi:penicillin-binding transpeptidase domain-containing protein [Prosthecochloris sp. HL-130-GSB]|uniref:penicillin-binding transpeptidase domain-containing protein n=1 Tax=Prosthecochloris sp. HL-130-GSB TaxID=1974213 RepID=UPI000A1BFECB|nr:penicillin-binding transpeptidase domain-containing protein [Prosthecochloris sp. HL-130-GSB]ARM31744.1 peptidoglycan glycosyltransferase [Prosthecochloris sp. HL-130-GSB]
MTKERGKHSGDRARAHNGQRQFALRLGVVVIGYTFFLVAIVLRLLNIQVVDVEKYKSKASRQYQREVVEQAKRGVIYDRNGRLLAESVQTISFSADPQLVAATPVRVNGKTIEVDRTREVAGQFATALGKSRSHYEQILSGARKEKRRFVWIERSVPVSEARSLMENPMTGVYVTKEQHRYYLNLAPQLIGLVDTDNKGISGLEVKYDRELRGRDGMKIYQRSATGRRFLAANVDQVDAREGLDLHLTIDADVQAIVEAELENVVQEFDAAAATAIVMDVKTGALLAIGNYPSFDMNDRSGFKTSHARNRAVADAFDPGSTFKIVMASAATEVLGVTADDSVDAHGGMLKLFNRTIRDHEKFDRCTFRDAMVHSSNVVAAETAMKIGAGKFYEYVRRFGFGEVTGSGIVGESAGIVRSPDEWDSTTLPWMGHGYSLTSTPLQVLQAYAAIANDGVLMRPYVVNRLVDAEGRIVHETAPQKVRTVVGRETARYVSREYLQAIVENGTGSSAAIGYVPVAGKTGTAQKLTNGNYNRGKRSYISSFVGFSPVDEPRIAAIVVVDDPKNAYYASMVAAPSFSRICSRMIACSEPLKKELGLVSPAEKFLDDDASVVVPLLTGLTAAEARKLLDWSGLKIRFSGEPDAVITRQELEAGVMVRPGTVVDVGVSGSMTAVLPSADDMM